MAVGGAIGLAIFALLVGQATRVEDALPAEARSRFTALQDTLAGRSEPLVWWGEDGAPHRRVIPVAEIGSAATPEAQTLFVLAYRSDEERLVEIELPLWFLRLKEPVIQHLLREADFDWRSLGLDVAELRRAGPGLVLHEEDAAGDALLLWLE